MGLSSCLEMSQRLLLGVSRDQAISDQNYPSAKLDVIWKKGDGGEHSTALNKHILIY